MTNTFADALGCDFDVNPVHAATPTSQGLLLYDAKKGEFTFSGPLFCNLLTDEMNHAPPRRRPRCSAMQEKQVTIGTVTHKLPAPFIVMATRTPSSRKVPTPARSTADRFMFKMSVGYHDRADEDEILRRRIRRGKDAVDVDVITDPRRVVAMQQAESVCVDPSLRMYMVEIVPEPVRTPVFSSAPRPVVAGAPEDLTRCCCAPGRDFILTTSRPSLSSPSRNGLSSSPSTKSRV